ncbi:hypothetical protein Rhopal_004225-T1 [Rhodotorula paludigena]|uniref:Cyclin-like domain-containing protein n=1 Tax=Rhodotorula paludigena TaxID=86838 RepID=A0AAV5GQA9_9BASI|nr:hypothetical protein Rhopal_004225-T1 [Rhodotorula paludigena]
MAVQRAQGPPKPPQGPPVQLYHQSSQYRHWRYSKEDLDKVRSELNEHAVSRVRSLWEEERAQQAVQDTPTPVAGSSADGTASEGPSQPATPPPPADIEYLTVADEQALVSYYLTQIVALCNAFKFPEMVLATAMSYLKRFYLRNTAMDYHPRNIMLTCVFLATKTENFPISIDTFAAKVKTPPAGILSLEFLVSQSLHFEYKVHHAHVALSGLVLDMQTAGVPAASLTSALPRAHAQLRASRLSPAELVYSPAQIALACMRAADRESVETWLGVKEGKKDAAERRREEVNAQRKGKGKDGGEGLATPQGDGEGSQSDEPPALEHAALLRLLDEIQAMVQDAQKNVVDKARATEIDKRLKWARNPEKDPKSALYKKRQAEEQAQREEKERAKAAKRPPQDDGSVFD